MRVTYLSATGAIGGAERVLLDCLRATRASSVSLVALAPGPLLHEAARLGADVRVVQAPASLDGAGDAFGAGGVLRESLPILAGLRGFLGRFSQAVAECAPDIIHSHGVKTHVLSAMLPRRPAVVWHLHDYIGTRPVSSRLLRVLAHRCDAVIAVSESVAGDARGNLPGSLPIAVVHNAVDTNRFVPVGERLDLDALSGLPPAPPATIRVGLPATFAKWKGHDVFLKAISQLQDHAVRAYVIGGPLYRTQNSQWSVGDLRQIADSLALAGRIGFTGVVDDMPAAYRALDIVVHASTRPEPFGLVIAEAMACGRAVVVAPAGGAGELIADGVNAVSVHGGDPAALAATLDRVIAEPQLRQSLGRAARQHALASFGHERFASELNAALMKGESRAGARERGERATREERGVRGPTRAERMRASMASEPRERSGE
jgi:glycosyltransferase involved in cell wall biosynthesis